MNLSHGFHYLDLANWSRRQLFEFFIGYTTPYFQCLRNRSTLQNSQLSCGNGPASRSRWLSITSPLGSPNEIEPFRYRLKDGKVFVSDAVNGGTLSCFPMRPSRTRILITSELRKVHYGYGQGGPMTCAQEAAL